MDDFPASPASPAPRRPPLSVVIPVFNGGPDFERCLRGVRSNLDIEFELVVVDDGSTDGSAEVAERFGARVIRHETPRGPAAARNAGALAATAPIVFFLDADVEPHPDALYRALARFRIDPELAALFGSYDDRPSASGLVSRYRNLLHHYVHQQGEFVDDARPAHTFWTGCGAIRRSVFLEIGGFDPSLYRRPAIEDIELGYRLSRSGHRVLLCRDVQATHLKRWTLRSVVRTDIFCRGVPWMLLMLRSQTVETDLNVSQSQRASVAATGIALASLPMLLKTPLAIVAPILCLIAIGWLNRDFYRFLARTRSAGFAFAAFPMHLVYFGCCGLSVAIALVLKMLPRAVPLRRLSPMQRTEPGSPAAPMSANAPIHAREHSSWTDRP
jgi:cellulose synthase/poly-beta-1,6-N-acetylglucosamine synthase-like glycosyltransferase